METFESIVSAPSAATFLFERLAGAIMPVSRVKCSTRQAAERAQAPFHGSKLAVLPAQIIAMGLANLCFKPL
jgi:hypothetical protein